jgi:hypothetical protein
MHVTGVAVIPHTHDTDLCLLHIRIRQANAIQHGLRSRLRFILCKRFTVFI